MRILPEPAIVTLPEHAAPALMLVHDEDGAEELPAALDRGVFEELVHEIGEQAAAEVRTVFTEETENRMKLLRALSLDRDTIKIGREAHSLKSSAGTFGYCLLSSIAEELEEGARWLAEGEYRDILDRMDAAYSAAKSEALQR